MGRPKKSPEESLRLVGVKLSADTELEIEQLMAIYDRPKSWVGRRLILKGLAAYRKDQSLDVPGDAQDSFPPSIPEVTPEQMLMSNPNESKKRPRPRVNRAERADLERAKEIIRERRKRDKEKHR